MTDCWWFDHDQCSYSDPKHCNKKDKNGNTMTCPRESTGEGNLTQAEDFMDDFDLDNKDFENELEEEETMQIINMEDLDSDLDEEQDEDEDW